MSSGNPPPEGQSKKIDTQKVSRDRIFTAVDPLCHRLQWSQLRPGKPALVVATEALALWRSPHDSLCPHSMVIIVWSALDGVVPEQGDSQRPVDTDALQAAGALDCATHPNRHPRCGTVVEVA